jgi:outer membrane murein-binding lipoprotein Lpp
VLGLAVINAGGTYSQPVAAYVGERCDAKLYNHEGCRAWAKIEVASHAVADLDARVAQIDSAIAEAIRRGRTNAALAAMEGQRRTRAGFVDDERNREAGSLAGLKAERASVAARGGQVEAEAAPIR